MTSLKWHPLKSGREVDTGGLRRSPAREVGPKLFMKPPKCGVGTSRGARIKVIWSLLLPQFDPRDLSYPFYFRVPSSSGPYRASVVSGPTVPKVLLVVLASQLPTCSDVDTVSDFLVPEGSWLSLPVGRWVIQIYLSFRDLVFKLNLIVSSVSVSQNYFLRVIV